MDITCVAGFDNTAQIHCSAKAAEAGNPDLVCGLATRVNDRSEASIHA